MSLVAGCAALPLRWLICTKAGRVTMIDFETANGKMQDEIGGLWSRERYLQMDADFCSRLENAIARGEERRPIRPNRRGPTARANRTAISR
jgi:hypothetical protein